jgi:hemolysin (HlyC) family protein
MDDTDGSSTAALSAQGSNHAPERGFFARLADAFSSEDTSGPVSSGADVNGASANGATVSAAMPLGMASLRRLRLEDVALPRADIVSVSEDISPDELLAVFRGSGLSRLPVYADTLDTPVGMIHLKDFALRYGFNGENEDFNIDRLVRPLLFAPPSMPIGVLLQKMQSERMHMALVIDEYGGVDGLVTIEDLIEQVLGAIEDEHDVEEDTLWTEEKPGVYLAQAKTPLEEFETVLGLDLASDAEDDEIDTLGGLVSMLAGRLPVRGEVVPHFSGLEFEIVDADPRRIKRIRVRCPNIKKN